MEQEPWNKAKWTVIVTSASRARTYCAPRGSDDLNEFTKSASQASPGRSRLVDANKNAQPPELIYRGSKQGK